MIAQLMAEAGGVETRLRFEAAPPVWVIFLILLPVVALYAWLLYRGRTGPAGPRRWLLLALRAAAVVLLLLAIFRPARERIRTREVQDQVLVLLDDSASMGRVDGLPEGRATRDLAAAAGLGPEVEPGSLTRLELARRVLARPGGFLEGLRSRFGVGLFGFAGELFPLADPGSLSATGRVTRLGQALRSALAEAVGSPTAAVVVVSDGRSNDGFPPKEAAAACAAEGIPVHALLCGAAGERRNAAILDVEAPSSVLAREEVTFKVRLQSEGLGDRGFRLSLARQPGGEVLAETQGRFPAAGGPQAETLKHRFEEPGLYTLLARLDPAPAEAFTDDNEAVHHLTVTANRIRVLYVEDYPRWEYRYLKGSLLRADQSIEAQCFLYKASADFLQEATPGLAHLKDLPRDRKTLLRDFAVVILGDVDPDLLGTTARDREEWLRLLKEFVEFGGGLICQAGVRAMPYRYRDTPVEDLLPVVLADPEERMTKPWDTALSFRPVLENPGALHPVLRLLPAAETNRLLWSEGLAGFYWYAPVRRPRAGATVLLRHPEQSNKYGRHVLAAVWEYGKGRALHLGLDSFWRWRKYYGDTHFDTFWRAAIRAAAEGWLRRGSDRAGLDLEKRTFEVGEPVALTAWLRDEELLPAAAPLCRIFLGQPDGMRQPATLSADPAEPGTYRGTFRFVRPGAYTAAIHPDDRPDASPLAEVGFQVRIPDRELAEPAPDHELLAQVAAGTGGSARPLAAAAALLEALPAGGKRVVTIGRDPHPEELWDTGWLVALLIALLGVEWAVRKAVNLP